MSRERTEAPASPPCRLEDPWILGVEVSLHHRQERGALRVACGHEGVATDTGDLRTAQRRTPKPLGQSLIVRLEQIDQAGSVPFPTGFEPALRTQGPLPPLVPGTDLLTQVTAEDVIADVGATLFGDRAPQLDRQVGDAPPRVQDVWLGEGLGRADL